MKKIVHFLIQKYSQMSGDKKVRIGLVVSQKVRKLIKSGLLNIRTCNRKEKYLYSLEEFK